MTRTMQTPKTYGFTLIEVLIVTGVLGVVSLVIAQVLFTTIRTNTKSEVQKEIKYSGDYALDTMTRMIQNAIEISAPGCDETGIYNTSLTLKNPDGETTTFSLDGTRIASVGSTTDYLTGTSVAVIGSSTDVACENGNPLQFKCTSVADKPWSIEIIFCLKQARAAQSAFEQAVMMFGSTVTIRN